MPITTVEDVRTALVNESLDLEDDLILKLIQRAEDYLEINSYDISIINPKTIKIVVSEMVKRVAQNPLGIRQETETTGPVNRSVTYAGSTPGSLFLTDEEKALLRGKGRRQAFTINTALHARSDRTDPCIWW